MTEGLKPRETLLVLSEAPHISSRSRERLDLLLALAAGDWPVTVVFVDAGVLLLAPPAGPAELQDYPAGLGMLPLFGVDEVWAERGALQRYGLADTALRIPVRVGDAGEIRQLMEDAACLM